MDLIFYKNLKKHKKTSEKNLVFSIFGNGVVSNEDDLISKSNECKSFYNLSISDGALKTGLGFKDFEAPISYDAPDVTHPFLISDHIDEIGGIWLFRWFNPDVDRFIYEIFMTDSQNVIWGIPLEDEFEGDVYVKTRRLVSEPTFECQYRVNNVDGLYFFSNDGMVIVSATGEMIVEDVPALISCVVHYDNFFGITNTNRNTLIYTTNLNIQEWSEEQSSTIEFLDNRGSFNKLIAFNDYVYLFREYGITKISIYTSKDDFSFTHLYTSSSKIYEKSVCVCGDKVFFMTRDGLYAFNGSSVTKIVEQYDVYFKNLNNNNCSSACLNGKYYFATKCDFNDGEIVGCEGENYVNNVLFEIDIETYQVRVFRGVDIKKLLAVDNGFMSKLCACFHNTYKNRLAELTFDGQTFGVPSEKKWKSFVTDLSYQGKRKKVKEILLSTKFDLEVEIASDEETKSFKFLGSEVEQRLSVSVYGKNFQFIFKTNEQNCEVKKPMIVFDVVS